MSFSYFDPVLRTASQPNTTPEDIRKAIDKVLSVNHETELHDFTEGKSECSVVVNSTRTDRPSYALCDLDRASRKLLAARNLRILIDDVDTLLSANDSLLLPRKIACP